MSWLIENASLVANLASLAMLAVWTFYAVLFYREFKRQRTPFLVIHQAQGHGLDSTCLVVNLSREPIHVLCVLLVVHTAHGAVTQRLRNFRRVGRSADSGEHPQTVIKQGPLASGAFLGLGSFEAMLDATREELSGRSEEWWGAGQEPELRELIREVEEMEVRVIALHGAHDRPIGASRRFRVLTDGDGIEVEPAALLTRQMSSRSESRIVRRWLQDCLPRPVSDER